VFQGAVARAMCAVRMHHAEMADAVRARGRDVASAIAPIRDSSCAAKKHMAFAFFSRAKAALALRGARAVTSP